MGVDETGKTAGRDAGLGRPNLPDLAGHGQPIGPPQIEVQRHQVHAAAQRRLDITAIPRLADAIALVFETATQHAADLRIVVHDKDVVRLHGAMGQVAPLQSVTITG